MSAWSNKEIIILRKAYPDFRGLEKALPERSRDSIRWKAKALGLPRIRIKWTSDEDDLLVRHYPDYDLLQTLLPTRSRLAIKSRAGTLNLQHRAWWSGADLKRFLSLLKSGVPLNEMREHFPGRSLSGLETKAYRHGLRKGHRITVESRHALVQEIRRRCASEGVYLDTLYRAVKVDDFLNDRRIERYGIHHRAVAEAIHRLGGEMTIKWDD